MKNTIPQKIPVLFSRPQKNPCWPKCQTQKNPSDPPVIKICEWGPWAEHCLIQYILGDPGAVGSGEKAGRRGWMQYRYFLSKYVHSPSDSR